MKFALVIAAVLAVSSAQFNPFPAQPGQYKQPFGFPVPSPSPLPAFVPGPSIAPVVNRVASSDSAANVIAYKNDINPDGSFAYSYQTDNGIAVDAQGIPRQLGGNPPVAPIAIQGSYSYPSPDGQITSITYTADENGYQAQGPSIPTPHPIPEYILRALDFIAKNPPAPQKK